jgi:hypothetical protein
MCDVLTFNMLHPWLQHIVIILSTFLQLPHFVIIYDWDGNLLGFDIIYVYRVTQIFHRNMLPSSLGWQNYIQVNTGVICGFHGSDWLHCNPPIWLTHFLALVTSVSTWTFLQPKHGAACSSEMSTSTYNHTRCQNPNTEHLNNTCHEILNICTSDSYVLIPFVPVLWVLNSSVPMSCKISFVMLNVQFFPIHKYMTFLIMCTDILNFPWCEKTSIGIGQPLASH